ncbi:peptidase M24 [Methanocaldococcus infernus ME]|uniref:Peptidase M24 n=1 Tax=Methanocaldococcus infernus (strain DSM 11812 / JCM 15783 / ME) TaxID=573063 RepID=D5VSY1_METIM|nr:M24 family metallopeptidase [Methanocaldococcus infernus]ADG13684.1 peptidase M24 [Methanocaldococcus infernus ME]
MKINDFLRYMECEGLKKVVLTKRENINYFLGKYFPFFSVLVFEEKPILYVGELDLEYAKDNLNIEVRKFTGWKEIFEGCDGVESELKIEFLKYLDNYKIVSEKLRELRAIKEKEEIEKIKKAAKISDKAMKYIIENPEGNEREKAIELEYLMRKEGAIKAAFDSIVVSGRKTSYPHALPEDREIKDILLVDIGACYEGYCSDITRTLLLNERGEFREIYNLVKEAKELVEDYLREGVSTKFLDLKVREYFKEYEKYFIHSLGHGVGLEVHEFPTVSKKEEIILKENMVITIEPGIYIKDKFGVRLEDLYLIKKDGFEKLSKVTL